MKTTWTKENKADIFVRTKSKFVLLSIQDMEGRGLIPELIKSIIEDLPDGCWLAGSWFESLYRGETPKDLDVFFRDESALREFIEIFDSEIGEDNHWSDGYVLPDDEKLEGLLESEKITAITLENTKPNKPPIQVIKARFFESAEDIVDGFDFTVCQFAVDKAGITCNPLGILDMSRKKLIVHRITFPTSTMRRLIKYAAKGYYACGGSLITMMEKMRAAPSDSADVLYVD